MAEIAQDSGGKGRKKMSTRIDMTPMVDLGFLLITFFVLVTTFSKPSAMDLMIPAKPDDGPQPEPPKVDEVRFLTLVPDKDDKLYWYRGITDPVVKQVDFSQSEALRPIIKEAQDKLQRVYGSKDTLILLIKPTDKSVYKNMVDLLDEVAIAKVKFYAISDYDKVQDSIIIWKGTQPDAGAKANPLLKD